jgi:hypothetical protein
MSRFDLDERKPARLMALRPGYDLRNGLEGCDHSELLQAHTTPVPASPPSAEPSNGGRVRVSRELAQGIRNSGR